jgi:acyl carrier protein
MAELKRSTAMTFSDMGIDSQMSIAILADFQKATAVELPAAFFINFPTLAAVEKELGSHQQADVSDYDRNEQSAISGFAQASGQKAESSTADVEQAAFSTGHRCARLRRLAISRRRPRSHPSAWIRC